MKRTTNNDNTIIKHKERGSMRKKTKLSDERKSKINKELRMRTLSNAVIQGRKKNNDKSLVKEDLTIYKDSNEESMFLWDTITSNSEIIYPTNFKKYNGAVDLVKKSLNWHTIRKYGPNYAAKHKTFHEQEEAYEYIIRKSIKEGSVKNLIYKYNNNGEDEYYCALTNNQLML